jgi:Holliday junction resolvase RusA-like endonuclease
VAGPRGHGGARPRARWKAPCRSAATFTLPRPKSAAKGRWAPDRKPDLDKLRGLSSTPARRAAHVIDDAQVVTVAVSKVYPVDGNLPGVTFTIAPAERGEAVAA